MRPRIDEMAVPVQRLSQDQLGDRLLAAVGEMGIRGFSGTLEIAAGHLDGIADRLALLFRMDRALAPVILSLAERVLAALPPTDPHAASLNTLRGDIYRALGREAEANAAYQVAFRAVAPRPTSPGSTT